MDEIGFNPTSFPGFSPTCAKEREVGRVAENPGNEVGLNLLLFFKVPDNQ